MNTTFARVGAIAIAGIMLLLVVAGIANRDAPVALAAFSALASQVTVFTLTLELDKARKENKR